MDHMISIIDSEYPNLIKRSFTITCYDSKNENREVRYNGRIALKVYLTMGCTRRAGDRAKVYLNPRHISTSVKLNRGCS